MIGSGNNINAGMVWLGTLVDIGHHFYSQLVADLLDAWE